PKCYFDDDRDIFDWVTKDFSPKDKELFVKSKLVPDDDDNTSDKFGEFHRKPCYKSLDTSIMELADDISYSIHDLEDAISLGMVDSNDWMRIENDLNGLCVESLDAKGLRKKLFSDSAAERKQAISALVNYFVTHVKVDAKNPDFQEPLLKFQAYLPDKVKGYHEAIHKGLTVEKVIKNTNVQLLQFKGQMLIVKLFEALATDPKRFLPKTTYQQYTRAEKEKAKSGLRVICDYVSGMTDGYATRLYEKLYVPNKGSVFDHL
ncbi:dGTPase, partial [Sansalvadorimonas sp. 2012CJ34-2]|nr:dGTPase [Sansalvadorimonas sp. 2012CJ34-2]